MTSTYQLRISYTGDITTLLKEIISLYDIGSYRSYRHIEVGYEDYNVELRTNSGSYFVKIFNKNRDISEIQRYISIVQSALKVGVKHPNLLLTRDGAGHAFVQDIGIYCVITEWLDGKTFWDLNRKPNAHEKLSIINNVIALQKSDVKPPFFYDSWAINNIAREYELSKEILMPEEHALIDPVLSQFAAIDTAKLPHALVHGDIISPNVMSVNKSIYLIDFSVANYMPRIQELAVMLSDLFFDAQSVENTRSDYLLLITEYNKHQELTDYEYEVLPIFIMAAHAMHVIRTRRFLNNQEDVEESTYWNILGMEGLQQAAAYSFTPLA